MVDGVRRIRSRRRIAAELEVIEGQRPDGSHFVGVALREESRCASIRAIQNRRAGRQWGTIASFSGARGASLMDGKL